MRVLPDSLPLPVFPAKPDWKNIGWEAFDGANLLNCILSRINPFYLDQYANSSYRNPNQILTERPHNLKLVRETELDRLAPEISEKVQPKKPSIDWKLIGRVTLIVGGIAIMTCVNAMSGGSLTPLQMALIAGATGAVVDGKGEIISNLSDGEPVNWGAVAARTAGGGAKDPSWRPGGAPKVPGLKSDSQMTARNGNKGGSTLKIDLKQFGKKFGKHAYDFRLDPSLESSREKFYGYINNIFVNHDEVRQGFWIGLGETSF